MRASADDPSPAAVARIATSVGTSLRRLDAWQGRRRGLRVVFAVVKRFGEDRGGALAALITFYAFLSLFPLLLLATTVLGFVLHGHPALRHDVEQSVLAQFPLIGQDLRGDALRGSAFAIGVGAIGLIWGSLGAGRTIEFAVNEVWRVPRREQPGFVPRLTRALTLYGAIGLAIVATSALTVLGPFGVGGALVVNCALFNVVLKILSPDELAARNRIRAAIAGGIGWQLVQLAGNALVRDHLRHMTELYGQFAIVLGAISILTLLAQLFVYVVEFSVVLHGHEWPRRLLD